MNNTLFFLVAFGGFCVGIVFMMFLARVNEVPLERRNDQDIIKARKKETKRTQAMQFNRKSEQHTTGVMGYKVGSQLRTTGENDFFRPGPSDEGELIEK